MLTIKSAQRSALGTVRCSLAWCACTPDQEPRSDQTRLMMCLSAHPNWGGDWSKISNGGKLYYLCPVRMGRSSTSVLSDTPQNSAAVAAYCGGKVATVSEGCKGSLTMHWLSNVMCDSNARHGCLFTPGRPRLGGDNGRPLGAVASRGHSGVSAPCHMQAARTER